jgi:hypothetical protein
MRVALMPARLADVFDDTFDLFAGSRGAARIRIVWFVAELVLNMLSPHFTEKTDIHLWR